MQYSVSNTSVILYRIRKSLMISSSQFKIIITLPFNISRVIYMYIWNNGNRSILLYMYIHAVHYY